MTTLAAKPRPNTRTVPATAFVAPMAFEFVNIDDISTEENQPIRMMARSAEPIDHWWWGRVIHDMEGLQLVKDRLPIDYCHDPYELVGYLDEFNVVPDGLETKGYLTPLEKGDRASRVLASASRGVPYEASINFAGDGTIEEYVPAGMSTQVNGKTYEGPITVIRQWTLRGVAVCPYGADMRTSANFNSPTEFTVTAQPHEEPTEMKLNPFKRSKPEQLAQDDQPEPKATETEAPAEPETASPEQVELSDDTAPAESETDNTPEPKAQEQDDATTDLAQDDATDAKSRPTGEAYMALFGETDGAVYFAKGVPLEEAKDDYIRKLKAELSELSQKHAKLQKQRGIDAPVSFDAEDDGAPKSAFAKGVKIRK